MSRDRGRVGCSARCLHRVRVRAGVRVRARVRARARIRVRLRVRVSAARSYLRMVTRSPNPNYSPPDGHAQPGLGERREEAIGCPRRGSHA